MLESSAETVLEITTPIPTTSTSTTETSGTTSSKTQSRAAIKTSSLFENRSFEPGVTVTIATSTASTTSLPVTVLLGNLMSNLSM